MGISGSQGRIGAPGLPGSQGSKGDSGDKGDRVSNSTFTVKFSRTKIQKIFIGSQRSTWSKGSSR